MTKSPQRSHFSVEGSPGDWGMLALAFLAGCLPLREEFQYTHLPAQHLLFILCLGKETGDGDAGEQPDLWLQTPSNPEEEQDEAQDGGHRRRPEQDRLWAHGWKVGCSASLGKALALPKDEFNSYSPVPFNAILQRRVPESALLFTRFPQ